ncbi:MAG: bifunctional diaminohydroxyphosphoribosylaminopyrimidine deaminase/5-amino-6-(5-phosphoribosylamino)uracil reductase RibD [Candidatus Bipolaricaulota bacterium]
MTDADFMRLALDLAEIAEGDTSPNPLVGAVVVRDGVVIGRGYHRNCGGPHAETFALDEAGDAARGADLYVTLEPCCHVGRTPPCTDRILAAGIRRVVVATEDPNPVVAGRGIDKLRAAGVHVEVGLLRPDAERQTEIFRTFVTTGRPFVHLKLAVSLDGRIATRTGASQWITGEEAQRIAHRLRRRHAVVLIGSTTARRDDPRLSVRHVVGRTPAAVVVDRRGEVSPEARLFREPGRQTFVAAAHVSAKALEALRGVGCEVLHAPSAQGDVDLSRLLDELGRRGYDSVLVEGGGETAAGFLAAGLVHRVTFFIAPLLIGGREAVPAVGGRGPEDLAGALRLSHVSATWAGPDLVYTGLVARPGA